MTILAHQRLALMALPGRFARHTTNELNLDGTRCIAAQIGDDALLGLLTEAATLIGEDCGTDPLDGYHVATIDVPGPHVAIIVTTGDPATWDPQTLIVTTRVLPDTTQLHADREGLRAWGAAVAVAVHHAAKRADAWRAVAA